MDRVHGLLKWTRGGLPQMNYVNKSTFQMDKRWTTTNGLPEQSDFSDQSSGAEHANTRLRSHKRATGKRKSRVR